MSKTVLAGVLLSSLLYAFGLVAAVAALALIRPISWLGLRTRRRAVVTCLLAIGGGVGTLAWPTHETRVASPVSRLDQIVPIYQFSEVHETTIEASLGRTYRTICAVTVNEIALLRTLTFIRRFGRPGPDSILNPPGDKPFCEVALSSGFYLLADEPPSEMVLGTFVAAPKAARANPPPQITAATFAGIHSPGFAIAVMNFRLRSIGSGRTRLTTETRVFATDATIRWRFAAYWRVIYPGSSIIRMMWLRAIKRRAELPEAKAHSISGAPSLAGHDPSGGRMTFMVSRPPIQPNPVGTGVWGRKGLGLRSSANVYSRRRSIND